jgi:hypothetical protein
VKNLNNYINKHLINESNIEIKNNVDSIENNQENKTEE